MVEQHSSNLCWRVSFGVAPRKHVCNWRGIRLAAQEWEDELRMQFVRTSRQRLLESGVHWQVVGLLLAAAWPPLACSTCSWLARLRNPEHVMGFDPSDLGLVCSIVWSPPPLPPPPPQPLPPPPLPPNAPPAAPPPMLPQKRPADEPLTPPVLQSKARFRSNPLFAGAGLMREEGGVTAFMATQRTSRSIS